MKKFLAIFLAVVMTLSMVSTAFAARYTDVANSDYGKAIENLSGLGIIAGYDDGSYQPAKVVTRAEMAKLLVVSLGLDVGASVLQGKSSFDDVPTTHWATGYIAVAVQYGLIKGDGDGNFRPDDTVNYAEAATMVLRALGYDRVVDKTGVWPTNYLNKANELKIFDEVGSFTGANGATRGTVAQMMWNMMNTQMWEVGSESESNGLTYGKGETMLTVKFPDFNTASTTTPVVYTPNYIKEAVISKIDVIDADTVAITFAGINLDGTTGDDPVRFDNVSPATLSTLLKYDVLYTVEKIDGVNQFVGKSIFADTSKLLEGYITKVVAGVAATSAEKITVNGIEYTYSAVGAQGNAVGKYIYVLLDNNGKIDATVTEQYWDANKLAVNIIGSTGSQTLLVKSIKTSTDGKKTTVTPYSGTALQIDNEDKAIMYVTFNNGVSKIVSKDAIAVNTVVEKLTTNSGLVYVVTDNSVSGTIKSITDGKYVIGDNSYTITANGAQIKYESKSAIDTADAIAKTDVTNATTAGKALIGKNVIFFLTSNNEVAYIESEDVVITSNYGVLLFAENKVESGKQVATATFGLFDGNIVTYDVIDKSTNKAPSSAANMGVLYTSAYETGKIFKYELKDSKILVGASATTAIITPVTTTNTGAPTDLKVDTTLNKVSVDNGTTYYRTTDAQIVEFTINNMSVENLDLLNLSLKDLVAGDNIAVIVNETDNTKADYVIVASTGAIATSTDIAIINSKLNIGSDSSFADLYIPGKGNVTVEVTIDSGLAAIAFDKGSVVSYTVSKDSDGNDVYAINLTTAPAKDTVAELANGNVIITAGNFTEIQGTTDYVYEGSINNDAI
ncbi:MAG: S-layer homology domain-containing protein, partial [Desulfoplanes sp.]